MAGRECYHCKQWVADGEAHDCWTTTEAALTKDLPEHLQDAWERLRETAAAFGEQRIYASHQSIMCSRKSCYFFVRPKKSFLEVSVFLGRTVNAPQVRRATPSSRHKVVHIIPIRHRDEVEPPVTDWLLEAYELLEASPAKASASAAVAATGTVARPKQKPKTTAKRTAKQAEKRTARRTATTKRTTAAATTTTTKKPGPRTKGR